MRRYLLISILLIQSLLPIKAFAADVEPPVITAIQPASGTTQWWGSVIASFRVTDDAGCCTSAVMELVSQAGQVVKSVSMRQQTPEYPLNTTFVDRINLNGTLLGTFTVRATVTDFSGKSTTGALGSIEIYQPDWGPPSISAGTYAASVLPGQSFSGNFWANDDKDCCASASIAVFNSQGALVVTGSTTIASRQNALSINYIGTIQLPSDISPGTYDVKAMAVDNLNKIGEWGIVGAVTVNDPTPTPTPSPSPTVSETPSPSVSASPIPSAAPSVSASPSPSVSLTPKSTVSAKQSKTPVAIQSKTASPKLITINCYKGKLLKKVTAAKPVCPKGYKKK